MSTWQTDLTGQQNRRQQTDTVLVDVVKYMRHYYYNGETQPKRYAVMCGEQYRRDWGKRYSHVQEGEICNSKYVDKCNKRRNEGQR